jgi:hypothetical protein
MKKKHKSNLMRVHQGSIESTSIKDIYAKDGGNQEPPTEKENSNSKMILLLILFFIISISQTTSAILDYKLEILEKKYSNTYDNYLKEVNHLNEVEKKFDSTFDKTFE